MIKKNNSKYYNIQKNIFNNNIQYKQENSKYNQLIKNI